MIKRLTSALFLLASLTTVVRSQTPPGVNVKLSFAENKTIYRIGEPIKLVMEFSADREGYIIEYLPDTNPQGSDTVVISPDIGVTNWYHELTENRGRGRHVFSTDKLTALPRRVEITVNDRLRLDTPGRYTVSVTTRRVSTEHSPLQRAESRLLSTNSLTFEMVLMSEADEVKEVKRLSALLDANRNSENLAISDQLCYLTGDPSTHEKVRRFISPEHQNGSGSRMYYGLFIARNRALVLKLLEAGMRDPKIPVTLQLLHAATRLKVLLTHGPGHPSLNSARQLFDISESPPDRETRDAYVAEVAAGLYKRTGENQITTAFSILTAASHDSTTVSAGERVARDVLLQHFESLHPNTQDLLLRAHWDLMRDPALLPWLKKTLARSDPTAKLLRKSALKGLMEMAPAEARPYVIKEILNPTSRIDLKILGALEDKSLPEVDAALLDQVRRAATQNPHDHSLKIKMDLLVRFATDRIYQELMEVYRTVGEKLPSGSRAALLAYFAKHNEQEAIPMIEKVISEVEKGTSPWILSELTQLHYSDAIGTMLKKLLESDDPSNASHAAYLIGREGKAGDEKVLEARLKRFHEEWRDRVAEADAQKQDKVERELILALINGKSWKLPPERVEELKKSCITTLCKESRVVR